MGWWEQDEEGHSFAVGGGLQWGDLPADTFDSAIADVIQQFKSWLGRKPTKAELRAGLEFSLGANEEVEP